MGKIDEKPQFFFKASRNMITFLDLNPELL